MLRSYKSWVPFTTNAHNLQTCLGAMTSGRNHAGDELLWDRRRDTPRRDLLPFAVQCGTQRNWGGSEGTTPAKKRNQRWWGVHLIRYADDIVVTGKNQEVLHECRSAIAEFLSQRGLELSVSKTKVTHVNKGFDFLGFNFRRMERNLHFNKGGPKSQCL